MTATGRKPATNDLATRIAIAMRKLGIAGLPRNYELIYEAYSGTSPELTQELRALGKSLTQDKLDGLGRKYLTHSHGQEIVSDAQQKIARNIEECLTLLRQEQSKLEDYGRALDEASDGIANTDHLKVDIIQNFIRILTAATDSTISDSRSTIESMVARSAEIERVRNELAEYKRLAHTDVLTQLANRRAFDHMLAQIYDDNKSSHYFSLIIADIDHFKRINDTFGHPVGDRVIKLVASLFRAALRKDVFIARTGGEEFALILAGTTAQETVGIAERIRKTIEETSFVNQRTNVDYGPISLSLGACMASDADSADDLYRKADLALYASKNRGRNRVTMHAAGIDGNLSDARAMYRPEPA